VDKGCQKCFNLRKEGIKGEKGELLASYLKVIGKLNLNRCLQATYIRMVCSAFNNQNFGWENRQDEFQADSKRWVSCWTW
jgi:hypothetical protein